MASSRAGKMNQITHCDWLPERARWSSLARSGLPAVSRKKNFAGSPIINPLIIDQACSVKMAQWILALFFFGEFMDLNFISVHKHTKEKTWPISSHLDLTLVQ